MRNYIKELSMKKLDFILITIILLLSLVPLLIFNRGKVSNETNKYLSIQVNGEEIRTLKLGKGNNEVIPIIKNEKVTNIVAVTDGVVDMIEADCPDQLCVKATPISKVGETIVCLPNRVVLEVKGTDKEINSDKSDINSY